MSDAYANNIETVLSFEYVPTGKAVYFKAFITALNEAYNTSYNTESGLFGRVDPIHTFSNIQRNISFTFKVPAASGGEAFENLGNVQQLAQFMYPTYEDSRRANTISESPLIRLKVMNIIQKPSTSVATNTSATGSYAAYQSSLDTTTSLLGTLNSISIDHNLGGAEGVIEKGENVVLPKLITVTCDFTAIHEEDLGWDAGGEACPECDVITFFPEGANSAHTLEVVSNTFANEAFPYGAVLAETQVAPAASSTENAAETQARDGLAGTEQFLAEEEAKLAASLP